MRSREPSAVNATAEESILFLEEAAANAWPAPRRLLHDGWLIGLAGPITRRANSVIPLAEGRASLDDKIAYCRDLYHRRGRPAIFKMTAAAQPPGLDEALAERGYRIEAHTRVMTAGLTDDLCRPDPAVEIEADFNPGWLEAAIELNGLTPDKADALAGIVRTILPRRAFVRLLDGDRIAAVGLGVYDRGYVGLFDLVVRPELRGRGLGVRLIKALLDWGRGQGARRAYLQVEEKNSIARNLYSKLGFEEAYRYWYRVLPL